MREDLKRVLEARAARLDEARPQAVAQQRKRGRLTAREAIAKLADDDTFVEFGGLAAFEEVGQFSGVVWAGERVPHSHKAHRRPRNDP